MISAILLCLLLIAGAHALDSCLNQSCGSITNISYPFTLTRNSVSCPGYYTNHSFFQLFCNETTDTLYMLPDAVYNNSPLIPLPVMAIHRDSLIINFTNFSATMEPIAGNDLNCSASRSILQKQLLLPPAGVGPYVVSDDNDFASFGCTTGTLYTSDISFSYEDYSYLDYYDHESVGGCTVLLPDEETNPLCGDGMCCIGSLPPTADVATRYVALSVDYTYIQRRYDMKVRVNVSDPACSCDNNYATIFHRNYTDFAAPSFGVRMLWAIPSPDNYNNTPLLLNSPHYACSSFAVPHPVPVIHGYLCSCMPGFTGDGYANGTQCSDVDECGDPSLHLCVTSSKCVNGVGNYSCPCNHWYHAGDGRRDGSGCRLSPDIVKTIIIISSVVGFLLIVSIIIICIRLWMERIRRRNFFLNGGLELQQYRKKVGRNATRIFSEKELKIATNNYADEMKIGAGGFGTVYKGKLKDGKLVAIKRSIKVENRGGAQFMNEIVVLSQINHKHIVRLLGCCLETKTPLLVYEFVSNGTLAENLERKDGRVMGWDQRLKVGLQTSKALAYLHRAASPPILHRDVKPTNVLLDENWDAKVADFGISRLVPDGADHVSTVIQGTLGYLDPEYFQTLQLTDKSDVYSLGVMLVELITTLMPVDTHHRQPEFSSLALLFNHYVRGGRVEEIIDPRLEILDANNCNDQLWTQVDSPQKIRSSILSVATLAHRCLALDGHARPSMVEVEYELHQVYQKLFSSNQNSTQDNCIVQSYEVGAVVFENDQCILESSHSNSNTSIERSRSSSSFYISSIN